MMDTILNLGLNNRTLQGIIDKTKNPRFAWDSYRRFINMFGNVVLGISHEHFEHEMEKLKKSRGVTLDTQLTSRDLALLTQSYKSVVKKQTGKNFPDDPREQLKLAVDAVFHSWNNNRAIAYRRIHNITGLLGTAVNVQAMVFGNMGETSGTGVLFTRNPGNGKRELFGEFLLNAQGEDVVAGIRTPSKIESLEKQMPKVYKELFAITKLLEKHNKDMQDIEFTVEEGRLFILQTRNGKRTGHAAIKIAVDLVKEKLITKKEAILKVDPNLLNQLLHPSIDPKAQLKAVAKGLPASPGASSGRIVFTAEKAVEWTDNGERVILVRKETSPEDIQGMYASVGILTAMGGMTSHAAVVARGMGKCCVAGCSDISVDAKKETLTIGSTVLKKGDTITLNGTTGEVFIGTLPMVDPEFSPEFRTFMKWVDEVRAMKVRTNADTPKDAAKARSFGAEGIGLCRTEHMFFEKSRIPKIREMILAKNDDEKRRALAKLLPLQENDFFEIFKVMSGYPVTIRLLDPPLHEFLPQNEEQMKALSKQMNVPLSELKKTAEYLHEINPMLGHRGCRLAVTTPALYEMQVHAIIRAAIRAHGVKIKVIPEIEVPLVTTARELRVIRKSIEKVLDEYKGKIKFPVKIGTMIELPRACVTADEIAHEADFFSFGTNDLTQCTFGYSRDDAGKFLPAYMDQGILERDPTESIDKNGVGELMKMCVAKGRSTKPLLEIGICGEHGGEPDSVKFCHEIGLNYVSCSPYRVPIARLAAAQAALKN
ncbi:MAG: pyruvate, phosphate dikinase, partial [Patescibacteria group bacterium]